jgi:hypothetical protein
MILIRARLALLAIFLGSLLICFIAVIRIQDKMWPDDLRAVLLKLFSVYSPQVGVILGGIFAKRKQSVTVAAPLTYAALAVSALWNLPLVWRTLAFSLAAKDSASDLLSFLDSVAIAEAFLVAGVISLFFTRGAAEASPLRPRGKSGQDERP